MINTNNVACPDCGKILTALTFKDLKCEHCNFNLRVRFLKDIQTGETMVASGQRFWTAHVVYEK